MIHTFIIKAKRLKEFKYILSSTATGEFVQNPFKLLNDEYNVTIYVDDDDYNMLMGIFNIWNEEDSLIKESKGNLWNRLMSGFN